MARQIRGELIETGDRNYVRHYLRTSEGSYWLRGTDMESLSNQVEWTLEDSGEYIAKGVVASAEVEMHSNYINEGSLQFEYNS